MKSSFTSDLSKERLLSHFLDQQYKKHLKQYSFKRVSDTKAQLKGVDLVFTHKQTAAAYQIDEKAQLDYLNENLPAFAFELFYKKDGKQKTGWFLDTDKKTDFYSLITGIYADEKDRFTACNITFTNREKLLGVLATRGLNADKLTQLAESQPNYHGKMELEGLNPYTEGYLFFSRKNKAEKPVNLILRLDWLCAVGAGKRLV